MGQSAAVSEWNFACPGWEDKLRAGQSIVPVLPLDRKEAKRAVDIFDKLRLPDVPGQPAMREAAGEWQRDIVRAIFGSLVDGVRRVPEVFCMVPKKNSKTTGGAALTLTGLLMNIRPRAEFIYIGPTQEVADLAFNQTVGMIDADEYLTKRFHVAHHTKTITDRRNKAKLKVKTFDMKVVTGSKPSFILIDELHLMASINGADRVIGQIRGGMLPNPEAVLVIITTQSDQTPSGVFRSELMYARGVRDGRILNARMLPLLYEFPEAMQTDRDKPWADPVNWPMVLPNLNRSITIDRLIADFAAAREKGGPEEKRWASQHLNIEIGLGLHSDSWAGAEFWLGNPKTGASNVEKTLTLSEVLRRSEVVVVGIDGGGLDDLLGIAVLGRETDTGRWLLWNHAWAHEIVKDRRKEIASKLDELAALNQLTFVTNPGDDVEEAALIVAQCEEAGLLAAEDAIGVDSFGVAEITKALVLVGIEQDRIVGIPQGWQLNGAIKTAERNLAGGTLVHGGLELMSFAVANAKVVPRGNAISIDKQVSGSAKIDPLMATFDAVVLMGRAPEAAGTAEIFSL